MRTIFDGDGFLDILMIRRNASVDPSYDVSQYSVYAEEGSSDGDGDDDNQDGASNSDPDTDNEGDDSK